MRRRLDQALMVTMLALAVVSLIRLDWPYVLISLLGAIVAGLSIRIDRLEAEIVVLRINDLLGPENSSHKEH
jgi:cell division protein FtsW (lipid II flippase)